MNYNNITAVIPAAGKGSRLNLGMPKILAPLGGGLTILDVLIGKLSPYVAKIVLVVSPSGYVEIDKAIQRLNASEQIELAIQPEPSGMGDAIFRAYSQWEGSGNILIVWGDQVGISENTIKKMITIHGQFSTPSLTMPLARMPKPYVEYVFDKERLIGVLQCREGDTCHANGLSDAGTFLLSTQGLQADWDEYLKSALPGRQTGEINFLPFLPWLSWEKNWLVNHFMVKSLDETRGINTRDDLEYFKKKFAGKNTFTGENRNE